LGIGWAFWFRAAAAFGSSRRRRSSQWLASRNGRQDQHGRDHFGRAHRAIHFFALIVALFRPVWQFDNTELV